MRLAYFLDNEPRNKDVVRQIKKLIDAGNQVVILDKIVPLEWLTGLFGAMTSKFCKSIKDNPILVLYDRFNDWQEPFKSEIRNKIQ